MIEQTPRRFDTVLRLLIGVPLFALLTSGAAASVRALSGPRVSIADVTAAGASPTVVEVRIDTPGRVPTDLDVDLVEEGRTRRLATRLVPRVRWAFWNPLPVRDVLRVEIPAGTAARSDRPGLVRATATPGSAWLWWHPPVVRELALPAPPPTGPDVTR